MAILAEVQTDLLDHKMMVFPIFGCPCVRNLPFEARSSFFKRRIMDEAKKLCDAPVMRIDNKSGHTQSAGIQNISADFGLDAR
ncbi:hypothetical protein [Phyllobacterium zundukense]|jgi:hypothetical protein|uniref:Uncharacterized protein n=1 Tax=Phyllobacterium zundukense TaxID=1867719 RepID=A0ACD4D9P2_9HYPH|nr:hypothetical protein [Phyllobacterium zundukense]UXN62577.1 hypothetical protein N8E88_21765 [Phyllobacterium zundukense]